MGDLVSSQVPLVFHSFLAEFAADGSSWSVHVHDVLLQVKLVGENPVTVVARPRLSRLPLLSPVSTGS